MDTWTFQDFVIKVEVKCEVCEGMASDQAVNNFYHNRVLKYGGQWIGSREAMASWNFVNIFICAYIHFSGERDQIF